MDGSESQVRVTGLNMLASRRPMKVSRWPPATSTRPSASRHWPAQKMLEGGGTDVKVFVAGFQTKDAPPSFAPSHVRV